jgi:predicted dehydrogenase
MNLLRIGIIGAGERGCYVLGTRIVELSRELHLQITAICDINEKRIEDAKDYLQQQCRSENLAWGDSIIGTTDYKELIELPSVNCVLITTHTDQHRLPAVYAIESGKMVYLDKPIAVTMDDAEAIVASEKKASRPIIMGFTRRYESTWRKAKELLDASAIGTLQMIQIHSVIPYTRYFQMWHRKNAYSGGALNDKASHLLDVFRWMVGPSSSCRFVTAVGGRSTIFQPRNDAPLRCLFCDDEECPYRRTANDQDDHEGTHVLNRDSWKNATEERDIADMCVYRPGSDIIDHAIATYVFDNGVKANLFWAIYGPHAYDQETMELVGSRGRIILERETGNVTVHALGKGPNNETHTIYDTKGEHFSSSHYGADIQLIRDIRSYFDGKNLEALGCARAEDGLLSLALVHATTESIKREGIPSPIVQVRV